MEEFFDDGAILGLGGWVGDKGAVGRRLQPFGQPVLVEQNGVTHVQVGRQLRLGGEALHQFDRAHGEVDLEPALVLGDARKPLQPILAADRVAVDDQDCGQRLPASSRRPERGRCR